MKLRTYLRELGQELADPKVGIYLGFGVYGVLPLFMPDPSSENPPTGNSLNEPFQNRASVQDARGLQLLPFAGALP